MANPIQHEVLITLAGVPLTLVPHASELIGARVFVVLDAAQLHNVANYTPDELRFLAAQFKLAADDAESLARKTQRRRA